MSTAPPRRRLPREARLRQLMDAAWALVREAGTDALTLGRLAERAGVTKPVVYDHFGTRDGLLVALYEEFDARQTALMDEALARSAATLDARARVIAGSYVDCVMQQGREIPGVNAALAGSPQLERVKRDWEASFIGKCRAALAPFAGTEPLPLAALRAVLGAAEALSGAAAHGEITAAQACDELADTIVATARRHARRNRAR
ncbi:TetR/AcrR family transcriptional regulator [Luteimonas sp. Y-2-2-4F]|nr:TetR/AcrR family transcriptional regulator [Luteimonas sp. Y-2-2-4F]MCD9030233.1 TetR/AcrR family transcriptional regulator [Luteimonas sp. Y-2-2-4F]